MKKTFFAVALLTVFAAAGAYAQSGWMSRYWDGCKPSCSWSGKNYANGVGQCKECDRNNNKISTSDMNKSACDGGVSYTCWDMIPFVTDDPNVAYAFAATPSDQCGQCFELVFDGGFKHGNPGATHAALKGKKLIVMGSNMGGDVGQGQFDVLVPGGGVGAFDAFSTQIGVTKAALGEQYGGLLAALGNPTALPAAQTQLKSKCADVFGKAGHEWLKAGCDFYADWFMAANNPTMTYKTVTCPAELTNRYKNAVAGGPPSGNPGTNPTPDTYTLTVSRNPTAGGTATAAGTTGIAAGTQVAISATAATGYTFNNWTLSGSGTLANANNASTTVTVNGNVTVTANFTQSGGDNNGGSACDASLPENQRLVLTVNVEPAGSGGVTKNPNGCYSQDQKITVTAAPNTGYDFVEWAGEGVTNAQSSTIEVQMWWHRTITAKFISNGLPVRNAAAAKARAGITLKPAPGGFDAYLPAGHGYASYRVVDARGREVRRGELGAGAGGLSVGGLKRGVVFLRLEGKGGASAALKVVTY